jgi:triosephosphate isomerase
MTRRGFVCGNWKMNGTATATEALIKELRAGLDFAPTCDVAIAPPFTALERAAKSLGQGPMRLAAQNVNAAASGAFTGEISVEMLTDLCVSYVIVGHSERRTLYGETDEMCQKKVHAVLAGGTSVILCVGETLEQRESEQTLDVVGRQLDVGLDGVDAADMGRVVVAYEPVWAIGTGRTATPDQAQAVHAFIRGRLADRFGEVGSAVRIQYGGSVKPSNAAELFAQPDIDGGLIGGASLKAADFLAIIRSFPG